MIFRSRTHLAKPCFSMTISWICIHLHIRKTFCFICVLVFFETNCCMFVYASWDRNWLMLDSFWYNCSGFWAIVLGGSFFRFLTKTGSQKQAVELSVGARLEPGWSPVGAWLAAFCRRGRDMALKIVLAQFFMISVPFLIVVGTIFDRFWYHVWSISGRTTNEETTKRHHPSVTLS